MAKSKKNGNGTATIETIDLSNAVENVSAARARLEELNGMLYEGGLEAWYDNALNEKMAPIEEELTNEFNARLETLNAEHAALTEQLEAIGVPVKSGSRRGRPRGSTNKSRKGSTRRGKNAASQNDISFNEAICLTMSNLGATSKGNTVSPDDIATDIGNVYQTDSPNVRTMISVALGKMKGSDIANPSRAAYYLTASGKKVATEAQNTLENPPSEDSDG